MSKQNHCFKIASIWCQPTEACSINMLLCPCLLLISLSCQVLSCIFHLNSFRLGSLGVAQMGKFWFWWRPVKPESHIKPSALSPSDSLGLHYKAIHFFQSLPLVWSKQWNSFLKSVYFPYLSFTLNETQGVNSPTQHLFCSISKFKRQFDAC